LILVVRGHTGSLALAGSTVGALSIAAGVARPLQGRWIDRRGAGALLAICGVVHAGSLGGVVALAHARAPGFTLISLGALSGLALPPVSTSMRAVWGSALPASERTAAYSLVYLTQELSILGGPLALAGLIAAANASVAMIGVALIAAIGTIGFAALIAARGATPSSAGGHFARGAFLAPGMRVLVGVAALTGAVIGAIEVAAPTFATAHHASAASGLLIAALAIGGILGALAYGSRRWSAAPSLRLLVLLATLTGVIALTLPISNLVALGALLFAAGIALNPVLTTISVLVDDHVARASAAEAFGWLSFGIAGGTGAATAIAGALTHPAHPRTALIVAAAAGASGTALCAGSLRILRRRARQLV
jgi:MFS family permease